MNRADWAWLLAGVMSGLFCATLVIVSEVGSDQSHYGTKYTFTTTDGKPGTGTVEQVVEPVYATKITILTNGHARDIVDSVSKLGLNETEAKVSSITSNRTPPLNASDYFEIIFESIFAVVITSYLFRIVVKICLRILGVKLPPEEIMRDPSTSSG